MPNYRMGSSSEFLDIKEAAAYLRVCTKTIRKLIKAKELHAQRAGKQWRIMPADLRGYLATTRS